MGKKRVIGKQEADETFKYKSPNTGEYVMASQYIAEIIVTRKAHKDGVVLEYKYWNNKDHRYHKEFKSQVSQSAKLLQKYQCRSIISTLNELSWCFSLRNPTFLKRITEKDTILRKKQEEASKKVIQVNNPNSFSPVKQGKQSILSKLRNIGGEEKES